MHPASRCPQQAHPKHKKAQAEQHADVRRSGQCRRLTTGLCAHASLKNPKIVTTIHGGSGRLRYNASVNSVNEVAIRESSTVDSTQPRYDKTRVFLNGGYVEIQFVGIVRQAALRRVLAEVADRGPLTAGELSDGSRGEGGWCEPAPAVGVHGAHGPIGVLLDGRNGRLHHDAGTLQALSEAGSMPKLTHMVVLTSNLERGYGVIVKDPKGPVRLISADAVRAPMFYTSDETEARRLVR